MGSSRVREWWGRDRCEKGDLFIADAAHDAQWREGRRRGDLDCAAELEEGGGLQVPEGCGEFLIITWSRRALEVQMEHAVSFEVELRHSGQCSLYSAIGIEVKHAL